MDFDLSQFSENVIACDCDFCLCSICDEINRATNQNFNLLASANFPQIGDVYTYVVRCIDVAVHASNVRSYGCVDLEPLLLPQATMVSTFQTPSLDEVLLQLQ